MTVPDHLRAHAAQPPPPPVEQVRAFLRGTVSDADDLAEVRADLRRTAQINIQTVRGDLRALESVLADPPADEELVKLVGWDGNRALGEPAAPHALAWLGELVALVRAVVDEAQGGAAKD